MSGNTNLFAQYQTLVRSHETQFDPEITRLQEVVTQHLQNWQQHEQSLVEAQTRAIENIRTAIARDARWLLNLPEFEQYIQEAKPTPSRWSRSTPEIKVDANPLLWQIAISPDPVQITDYAEVEDPNGYDDENTFLMHGYQVAVRWGSYDAKLNEVTTERLYGVRDQRVHSLADQREDLESWMGDLFYGEKLEQSEKDSLGEELSYLVGYACQLLALKPRTVSFNYPIPQEEVSDEQPVD